MDIETVLTGWGLEVPADMWHIEYLQEQGKGNACFLDTLPLPVGAKNYKKYDQYEAVYLDAMKKRSSIRKYLSIESKFISLLTKLWLYNEVHIDIDWEELDLEKARKSIDNRHFRSLLRLLGKRKGKNLVRVQSKAEMEMLTMLGLRDIVFIEFYFEEYQLLVASTFSCFFVYLHNQEIRPLLKDMALSEGLFLRESAL